MRRFSRRPPHTRKGRQSLGWLGAAIVLCVLLPVATAAAPAAQETSCATEYTTQSNDWLSKIAEKYLGDPTAFPAIVAATNQIHGQDATFAEIVDPDMIGVGWKICVPDLESAQEFLVASSPQPTAPAKEGSRITVTDALGRDVVFSQPPERVVVAGRAVRITAGALFAFPEAKERVVALEGRTPAVTDFISLLDPDFSEMLLFERDVGPEQIVTAHPDVVVLKSYMADKLGTPLEQLDIPVVYVDFETPEQYFDDIATLGQLFGNAERADEIKAFYQTRLDRIHRSLEGLADEQKPSVLVLQYSDKGGEVAFQVAPSPWIQTTLVELAGGTPVWKESALGSGWTVVGFEQIAAWNPDMIMIVSYASDPGSAVAMLKDDHRWQALASVQGERLYAFPKDTGVYSWDQPDVRWILGLTWLAAKLHPDRLPDVDMIQEVYAFHEQLYGLDGAAVEASILPTLQGDVE